MGLDQYYEKVDSDETNNQGLMTGEKSSRVLRAPPAAGTKKRSTLTTVALGAVLVTIFLAAVAIVSSAVVSYRLPAATEAALQKQKSSGGIAATTTTAVAEPLKSGSATSETGNGSGTGFEGMDGSEAPANGDAPLATVNNTISFDLGHHQEMRTCGGTPDQARAAGCVFDVMMQLWTPPECMDSPLSERFLKNGNWTWYADSGAQSIYSDEEIRKGNHDVVYVAQSYHRHHCIFAWERLVRAMRNQAPLIEELISYDHVMHCRHKTLTLPSEGAESVRGVVAPTGYTKCASYDVWIKQLPFNKMSSTD